MKSNWSKDPYLFDDVPVLKNIPGVKTSEELKQIEEKILNSEELAQKMELNIYNSFKTELLKFVELIQDLSSKIAFIDCIASFANIAVEKNYVKPKINKSVKHIKIVEGRHPVVESILKDEQFVPNSIKRTTFVQTPADKHILQDDALDYRVLNLTGSTFNENNTSYWHKSIGGYHAAKLRRYQEMIDHHISPEIEAAYNEIAQASGVMEEVDGSKFNVLNMLNTKYFILPAGRNGEAIPIQNPYAYGNAWFVKNVSYVANANEEIETLYDINPRETAVVDKRFEETLKGVTTNNTDSLASITLTSYSPNHLVYETTNENDGIAIFSEIYYPDGWQVTIDGQPATLARANYILRALHLPAGKHVVEMKFDPQSLHLTEGIAYGALVLLLIGVITAICLTYTKKNRSYLHKQERLSQ